MTRVVRLEAPGRLVVAPADPPQPGPGEALIRVAWAGICGSDVDLVAGHRPHPFVRYPIVPGHEWSGTVEAVGDGVDPHLVRRAVVGEGFRSCQTCAACRRGEPTVCDAPYDETGFTQDGAWADYLSLPARLLYMLPEDADLRAAALMEPAACVAEACLRARTTPGERVAVVGGGTLGLLATQLLRASHPSDLVVIDPNPARSQLAEACGATALLTPDQAERLGGRFDAVIEAAGCGGSATLAAWIARRGGRVVLTGIPDDHDHLSNRQLVTKQLTVITVFGAPSRAWVHAVRAFATGILDPAPLVSHDFVLEDVEAALQTVTDRTGGAVKTLLHP